MIRGNLKLLALKALEKEPLSGYALMKLIEEKIGTKPSPGSIYPLLDELEKGKIVARRKDGRKIIYSLTAEGKENLKMIGTHKDALVKKVEESLNMWSALTGDSTLQFKDTVEALKKGKYSIEDIPPEATDLKMELARIFNMGLFQKNRKKIKDLLRKSAAELKKIK